MNDSLASIRDAITVIFTATYIEIRYCCAVKTLSAASCFHSGRKVVTEIVALRNPQLLP